jgi:hypothetical protein
VIDEIVQKVWVQFQRQLEKLKQKYKWIVFLVVTFFISVVYSQIWNVLTRKDLKDMQYTTYWSQVLLLSTIAYILYFIWKQISMSLVSEYNHGILKKKGMLWGVIVIFIPFFFLNSKRAREILVGRIKPVSSYTDKQLLYLYCINLIEEVYLCQTRSTKWERKQRPFLTHPFIQSEKQWETLISKDCAEKSIQQRHSVLRDVLQTVFSNIEKREKTTTILVNAQFIHDKNFNVLGCMTVSRDGVIYIFLRGTNNIMEWVGNIGGAVHTFSPTDLSTKHVEINSVAHLISDFLMSFVQKTQSKQKIIISGHSRGAILALYLALQMERIRPLPSYHLTLFAVPPLTDIETYLSFLRSNTSNTVEVLLHKNDVLGWINELYPLLTSFCPSYGHTTRVSNYVLKPEKKTAPSQKRFAFISFDPEFTVKQRMIALKNPVILHDLSDYILCSFR